MQAIVTRMIYYYHIKLGLPVGTVIKAITFVGVSWRDLRTGQQWTPGAEVGQSWHPQVGAGSVWKPGAQKCSRLLKGDWMKHCRWSPLPGVWQISSNHYIVGKSMRVTRSSCEPLRSAREGAEEPWILPSSALDLDHLHTHSLGPMAFQWRFSSLMPRHSLGGWGGWEADSNKIPWKKETVSNITDNNSSPSKKSYYWCTISCVVELKPCVLKYDFCHFLKSLCEGRNEVSDHR